MIESLDQFYSQQSEPNKGCLLALRHIILGQDDDVTETTKYGMPCFCFRNKMFCYLWTDKKTNEPYILMVEGNYLDYPELKSGDRKRMKVLRVDPNTDLSIALINEILKSALDLYRSGKIKTS